MPPFHPASSLDTFVGPDPISLLYARAGNATNATATNSALQVVCAFPVSGQYGPGSRVLYYALVAACVFARKSEALMNACLAAALLFPAVAAFHGIVLAAVHVDGAVDMDVFGAFQLCSIGILAAPVMARLSKTYFYSSGRNIIFLWTGLVLAGLLSLTVEFYRVTSTPCSKDNDGNPISNAKSFPYPQAPLCGLTCSTDQGPFSHLRGGSVNNIYVIPVPDKLTFGQATIMAAACCIPAILSLISMRNKILDFQWRLRSGKSRPEQDDRARIEGTKVTVGKLIKINGTIAMVLGRVEIAVFGGMVLAILIIGERNFFSKQVYYMSEPMYAIGQWAPIVGTSLAVLGSLGLFLVKDKKEDKEATTEDALGQHNNCSPCNHGHSHERCPTFEFQADDGGDRRSSREAQGIDEYVQGNMDNSKEFETSSAIDRTDDATFKAGPANEFPVTPGEEFKRDMRPIKQSWNVNHHRRSTDGEVSMVPHHASTFSGSTAGTASSVLEQWPSMSGPSSPEMMQRRDTLEVPALSYLGHTRSYSSGAAPLAGLGIEAMPGLPSSPELHVRKNTLEVPVEQHVRRTRSNSSGSRIISYFREPSVSRDSSGEENGKG